MDRPTDDADLHMEEPLSPDEARQMIMELCAGGTVEPDGLIWLPEAVKVSKIIDQFVPGLRVEFPVRWASNDAKFNTIKMKMDLAWGDRPLASINRILPVVLPKNFNEFSIRMYPWEQVLAEKLHSLARHGVFTSRMKDFYDLALIAHNVDIDAEIAVLAVEQVFKCWGSPPLPRGLPILDLPEYPAASEHLWQNFIAEKNEIRSPPSTLQEAVDSIRPLLAPLLLAISDGERPQGVWEAGSGSWTFTHRLLPGMK